MSCPEVAINGDVLSGILVWSAIMFWLGWLLGRMYQIWRG